MLDMHRERLCAGILCQQVRLYGQSCTYLPTWFCCIDALAVFKVKKDTEQNLDCFVGLHGFL